MLKIFVSLIIRIYPRNKNFEKQISCYYSNLEKALQQPSNMHTPFSVKSLDLIY